MQAIQSVLVSAALVSGIAAPVMAATTDPEIIIYRFPGVYDTGLTADTGVATSFHCTNFSGTPETIRFVTRDAAGALKSNEIVAINHLATATVSTHATVAYSETALLNTNKITQGTTAVAATSTNIICTAMTIDAAAVVPNGVALRGIRFSPVPGSQE